MIHLEASPGIDGSIDLLRLIECFGLPVGKSLRFGYFLTEEYSENLLQRYVGYVESAAIILEVEETRGIEVSATTQRVVVVVHRQSYLEDVGVFEQWSHHLEDTGAVESKQIAMVAGRQLKESHFVYLSFLERGACFRVETYVAVL